MLNSHDNIPSILSKENLCVLSGLCGEYVTAITTQSTRKQWGEAGLTTEFPKVRSKRDD